MLPPQPQQCLQNTVTRSEATAVLTFTDGIKKTFKILKTVENLIIIQYVDLDLARMALPFTRNRQMQYHSRSTQVKYAYLATVSYISGCCCRLVHVK